MPDDAKPPLLIFPWEVDLHRRLFEQSPIRIIKMYLDCFNSEGRQVFAVPEHVLETLAARLRLLMDGDCKTLDAAFGGSAARQRNRLRAEDHDLSVLWVFGEELERVRGETKRERGAGTPFEIALERAGRRLDMSPENVRRIYHKSGPKKRTSKSDNVRPKR